MTLVRVLNLAIVITPWQVDSGAEDHGIYPKTDDSGCLPACIFFPISSSYCLLESWHYSAQAVVFWSQRRLSIVLLQSTKVPVPSLAHAFPCPSETTPIPDHGAIRLLGRGFPPHSSRMSALDACSCPEEGTWWGAAIATGVYHRTSRPYTCRSAVGFVHEPQHTLLECSWGSETTLWC